MVIIDKKVYELLFVTSIKDIFDELFSLRDNGRFRKSRDENPEKATADFIAEINLYRIRDTVPVECCGRISEFLKSRDYVSLMEFSLFAFMLSGNKVNREDYI